MNHPYGVFARYAAGCRTLLLVGMVGSVSACDSLLDVELPGRLDADRLGDPSMIEVLKVGMLSDFECAFQGYALTSSVLTQEYYNSVTARAQLLWANRVPPLIDVAGDLSCTNVGGAYRPLHTARFQAEDLFTRARSFPEQSVPDLAEVLGTAAVFAAYSTLLLGEGFCEMAIDAGPLMTRTQVFQRAETWFSTALDQATSTDIRNLALIGRARARLNIGDTQGALSDATQVPIGYEKLITTSRSSPRRENRQYVATHETLNWTVAPLYRDLEIDGVPDTRVTVVFADRMGQDGTTPLWLPMKYTSHTDPVVLASWREAQLIMAEVQGGQDAVDAINRLRTDAGLPSFQSSDPQEIAAQVIEERRRELFLEGHRLGDMLRYGIPFPTGTTHKGEPYGSITCIPLPTSERVTNPNL
jgi:starch-binding outer membrane protein, SusD/RagB family